jgi:uncharacterized protein with HEPN domain
MPRDPRLYLDDILDAITRIREYTAPIDYEEFTRDRKTQDAVVRNLEIIGEAAGRLPESVRIGAGGIDTDGFGSWSPCRRDRAGERL